MVLNDSYVIVAKLMWLIKYFRISKSGEGERNTEEFAVTYCNVQTYYSWGEIG
jgi:hypothetical protein